MANVWTLQAGDKVNGKYMGQFDYSGRISSLRPHTINHKILMVFVELDNAIDVFGASRDSLVIHASNDEAAAAKFSGGDADTIEVAA